MIHELMMDLGRHQPLFGVWEGQAFASFVSGLLFADFEAVSGPVRRNLLRGNRWGKTADD